MNFSFLNSIPEFFSTILGILFAISIHEFGHAFVAHLNGDDTARRAGRMNINPMSHIDPFGMLMMFLVHFGWAKPVPVNPYNYRNEKIGNISVSLAGIVFNLISAFIFVMIYKFSNEWAILGFIDQETMLMITRSLVMYNVGFAAFNILPIPPLDGWSLISTFLPRETVYKVYEYSRYTFLLFIILMMTNILNVILNPIYTLFFKIVTIFV
ncbi:peptidase [Peptostreptococcus sp. MV1]|uniref:site-2 protease family protein n=1 Tax=Peptostreptococcus sp. MV1 TaxID=1219626 RepID=UPI00050FF9B4|nr:site-2 protease family protein [Peptostreptococcus sp. MV1]KGF14373.1 peptidase [Peptostreptococcus sp. MV1]